MKLHEFRLSTRITVSALIIVTVGAALLAFIENARIRDVYLGERRSDLKSSIEAEKLRLKQAVDALREDVLFLANTPPISGIVRASEHNGYDPVYGNSQRVWAERLEQIFTAFSHAHSSYYQIRFIGVAEGGRELVRIENRGSSIEAAPPGSLIAKGNQEYFKATLGLRPGETYFSDFGLNEGDGTSERPSWPTLRAATPVFTSAGKIFGMVVITMDVNSLLVSAVSDLPGVQTYISNDAGQYLLHPDPQRAFRFEAGSEAIISAVFPGVKAMFNPDAPDYLPLDVVKTSAGSAWVAAQRVHFDRSDPTHFLVLLYSIPGAVAARQVATIPVHNLVGGLLAMFLISGLALFTLRRAFSPLETIIAAADKIAEGNHDIVLPAYTGGEIGSLTNALNAMLAQLSQREKSLRESEAKYRRLHESMMDAYAMTDMSGRFLEFNRAYLEMLGYSAEELVQRTYSDLTPEKWHGLEARLLKEQIIPRNRSQVYEKEYVRKDGTVFPVEVRTFLLRDKDNQPEAMWAIVRDISRRKRAENTLRLHSEILRNLLEGVVLIRASDGIIVYTNMQFDRMFRYGPSELLGKHVSIVNAPGALDPDIVASAIIAELEKAGSWTGEVKNCRKDGTVFWSRANVSTFEHPDFGRVWVAVHENITARKRAEEELQRFFDLMPDLACIASTEGRLLKINAAWHGVLGFSEQELLATPFFDLVHPDEREATMKELERQVSGQAPRHFINRCRCNDGGYRWLEWQTTPAIEGTTVYATARDITERKHADEALRRGAERIEMLLNSVAEGIYGVDVDGVCTFINPAGLRLLGYQDEGELLGKNMHEAIHHTRTDGSYYPAAECRLYDSLRSNENVHVADELFWRKDGRSFPVDYWSRPIVLDGRNGAVVTFLDITERRQAEERLQSSAREIADLYNHAPCGYHSLDKDGNIRRMNDTELSWLGYTREEVIGKIRWPDLLAPESQLAFQETFPRFIRDGYIRDHELEIIRKDGTRFTGLVNASAIYDSSGNFVASRSTIIDITERKRVGRQLQQLSAHLQTIREEEKARIAREIHDDLGGTLTALKMDVHWLAKNLSAADAASPLLKRANSMSQLLDSAVSVTRRIITDLRPTVLDDLGLLAALEWQAAQFHKRTGIKCEVNGFESKEKLDRQYSIALFRIFQETLTNVARHSGASRVQVEFHCCEDEAMLSISDNGHGLPENHTIASTSYGIRGMRERVEQLGGKINFSSPPDGGFSVTVTLPLRAANQEENRA